MTTLHSKVNLSNISGIYACKQIVFKLQIGKLKQMDSQTFVGKTNSVSK